MVSCWDVFRHLRSYLPAYSPPLSSSTQDDDSTERKDSEDFFLQNTLEDSEIISIPDTINQAAIDTEKWFYLSKDRTNVGPLSIVQLAAFFGGMQELAGKRNRP